MKKAIIFVSVVTAAIITEPNRISSADEFNWQCFCTGADKPIPKPTFGLGNCSGPTGYGCGVWTAPDKDKYEGASCPSGLDAEEPQHWWFDDGNNECPILIPPERGETSACELPGNRTQYFPATTPCCKCAVAMAIDSYWCATTAHPCADEPQQGRVAIHISDGCQGKLKATKSQIPADSESTTTVQADDGSISNGTYSLRGETHGAFIDRATGELTAGNEDGWVTARATHPSNPDCFKERRIRIGKGDSRRVQGDDSSCKNCTSGCDVGQATASSDGVNVIISLGKTKDGKSNGELYINQTEVNQFGSTPCAVQIHKPVELEGGSSFGPGGWPPMVINYENEVLRQVLVDNALVDIQWNEAGNGTRIDFYHPENAELEELANGWAYFKTNNLGPAYLSWESTWTEADETHGSLTFAKGGEGIPTAFTYQIDTEDPSTIWFSGTSASGQISEQVTWDPWDEQTQTQTRTRTISADGSQSVITERFEETPVGFVVTERIEHTSSGDLITLKKYYDETAPTHKQGRLESVIWPDGRWEWYDYEEGGRPSVMVEPLLNSILNESFLPDPDKYRRTYYTYSEDLLFPRRPRKIQEKTEGQTTALTFYTYTQNGSIISKLEERCSNPSAYPGYDQNLRTLTRFEEGHEDEPLSISYSEGYKIAFAREQGDYESSDSTQPGTFTPNSEGEYSRITTIKGVANAEDPSAAPIEIVWKTTKGVEIKNQQGEILLEETHVYTDSGQYDRINWTVRVLNAEGHVTDTYSSNGEHESSTWNCCFQEDVTAADGTKTIFHRDSHKRVDYERKEGCSALTMNFVDYPAQDYIQTDFQYDGHNRIKETKIRAVSGTPSIKTTQKFDGVGRIVESTRDAENTFYGYFINGDGCLVTTVTHPQGTTNTLYYRDGRIRHINGDAQPEQSYEYDFGVDGKQYTLVSYGVGTGAYVKTFFDILGRKIREEKPGLSSAETIKTHWEYNNQGLVKRQWSEGGGETMAHLPGDILYSYDSFGDLTLTAIDVNQNGVIDSEGPDQVTHTSNHYENDGTAWWHYTSTFIKPEEGSTTQILVSRHKEKLTNLPAAPSQYPGSVTRYSEDVDHAGNVRTSQTIIDRANKIVAEYATGPESSQPQVNVVYNGLLVSTRTNNFLNYQYGYDGIGRRNQIIDPRTGSVTYHYNDNNQIEAIEDAGGRTTQIYYGAFGKPILVINPDDKATRYSYGDYGLLHRVWGDVPQPVEFTYDPVFGRLMFMSTYRFGSNWTSWPSDPGPPADVTEWHWDQSNGLLGLKIYPDNSEVAYIYNSKLQLETRKWARNNGNLTTTYTYDPGTGQITNVDYSDSTPPLAFQYDRLGRLKQVTDGVGTRTFAYDSFKLDYESVNGSGAMAAHDFVLTRKYQETGVIDRYNGFGIGPDSTSWNEHFEATYGFDIYGQFDSVDGTCLPAGGVTYGYGLNTNLVTQTQYGVIAPAVMASVGRSFEANRDLVSGIGSTFNATSDLVSSYAYQNDAVGRRKSVINTGSAFPSTNHIRWTYNARNELTEAKRFEGNAPEDTNAIAVPDHDFDYVYDPIGNRESGTLPGDLRQTYSRNALNQYTNAIGVSVGASYQPLESEWLVSGDPSSGDFFGSSIATSGDRVLVGAESDNEAGTDAGAAYVIHLHDEPWTQEAKLIGSTTAANDLFGVSVAMDGAFAVVGASKDDDVATDSGTAFIFQRNTGNIWTQVAKIDHNDLVANANFGESVAIDGSAIVVGAPRHKIGSQTNCGAAFVYRYTAGSWSFETMLMAPTSPDNDVNPNEYFGRSVAICGNQIMVGAPGDRAPNSSNSKGAVHYYTYSGSAWTHTQKLTASDAAIDDEFGARVALDGGLAVVSAPLDDDLGNASGSLYVFTLDGGSWSQHSKLKAFDGAGKDSLGIGLAVDSDGQAGRCSGGLQEASIIMAGAKDDDLGTDSGAVYQFRYLDGEWRGGVKIRPSDGATGDLFGQALAFQADTGYVQALVAAKQWHVNTLGLEVPPFELGEPPYPPTTSTTMGLVYAIDEVTGILPQTFFYDDDGNLTADDELTYIYDAENRLTQVYPSDPMGGDLKSVFTYDYQGRRVRKVVYEFDEQGQAWLQDSVEDVRFIYDGWNVVLERTCEEESTEEVIRAKYAWGMDMSGLNGTGATGNVKSAVHGAGGIGGLLATERWQIDGIEDIAEAPKLLYFYDANGNVSQLVTFDAGEDSNAQPIAGFTVGQTAARYEYDPYGGTLLADDPLNIENPFRFSTKYYDAQPALAAEGERGLYYYGYRYYSPRMGRWINRDPIGLPGGKNPYHFVSNSPSKRIDPLGLYEKDVHEFLTRFLAEAAGLTADCGLNPSSIGHEAQAVDEDPDREPTRKVPIQQGIQQREDYHFTTISRRQLMLQKAMASCNARDIGEFVHALQDSYSHQTGMQTRAVRHYDGQEETGYGPGIGHTTDGHYPDWTWERPELAKRMAKDVYNHLKLLGSKCGCCSAKKSWDEIELQVEAFSQASIPVDEAWGLDEKVADYEHVPGLKLCFLFPEMCSGGTP